MIKLLLIILLPSLLFAAPLYVYKEADGAIRFTSKKPGKGISYEVFTSKRRISYPTASRRKGKKLYPYEFKSIITSTSYKYSLPKDLIQAVIHVESAYNPKAVSPKGAKGLMQLMPSNLKIYGVRNPYSPTENINAGSKLLSKLVKKYNNINLALAAYNAGEGAVKKYNGVPPYKETKNYIKLVLYYQKKYKALA